jgi:UDP-glucose 4-epimerase
MRSSLGGAKVLVIGSAGFIGSFVVKELLKTCVAQVVIM